MVVGDSSLIAVTVEITAAAMILLCIMNVGMFNGNYSGKNAPLKDIELFQKQFNLVLFVN